MVGGAVFVAAAVVPGSVRSVERVGGGAGAHAQTAGGCEHGCAAPGDLYARWGSGDVYCSSLFILILDTEYPAFNYQFYQVHG